MDRTVLYVPSRCTGTVRTFTVKYEDLSSWSLCAGCRAGARVWRASRHAASPPRAAGQTRRGLCGRGRRAGAGGGGWGWGRGARAADAAEERATGRARRGGVPQHRARARDRGGRAGRASGRPGRRGEEGAAAAAAAHGEARARGGDSPRPPLPTHPPTHPPTGRGGGKGRGGDRTASPAAVVDPDWALRRAGGRAGRRAGVAADVRGEGAAGGSRRVGAAHAKVGGDGSGKGQGGSGRV